MPSGGKRAQRQILGKGTKPSKWKANLLKGSRDKGFLNLKAVSSGNSSQKMIIKTGKGIFPSPLIHFSFQNFWMTTSVMTLPVPRGLCKIPKGCLLGKGNEEGRGQPLLETGPDRLWDAPVCGGICALGLCQAFARRPFSWCEMRLNNIVTFSPQAWLQHPPTCLGWASLPYLGLSHSINRPQPTGPAFPPNQALTDFWPCLWSMFYFSVIRVAWVNHCKSNDLSKYLASCDLWDCPWTWLLKVAQKAGQLFKVLLEALNVPPSLPPIKITQIQPSQGACLRAGVVIETCCMI